MATLGIEGKHSGDGGRPSLLWCMTVRGMVGGHPGDDW